MAEDGILDKDDLIEIDTYKSKINEKFAADQIKTITYSGTIEYYLHTCWQDKKNGGKVKAEFEI